MRNVRGGGGGGGGYGGGALVAEQPHNNGLIQRPKFGDLLKSDQGLLLHSPNNNEEEEEGGRFFNQSSSGETTPNSTMSPYNQSYEASPYVKSPWITTTTSPYMDNNVSENGLIASIVREEGHIYSLAASGDMLYTGSDSKNIRAWKNLKEFSGLKSNSGLVKAIILSGDRIFTGHQDGKIRVWKANSTKSPGSHKRVGSLPTLRDFVKCSVNPKNYVEVRRKKNVVKIKHFDAVSSLSLNEHLGLLYSASWDRTLKVWRISDSKCLESINAHDDAINSVVSGFDSLVFTGSADGTVKVWNREVKLSKGSTTISHFMLQVLLKQESAVNALAVNHDKGVIYCGSSDGLVNYWDRDKHTLLHGGVLRAHKMAVLCLAAAGNLVFSGSADKNICVWKRDECTGAHSCLSVLTGHTGPVKCLSVKEDRVNDINEDEVDYKDVGGRCWIVYSGSLDKSVKLWRVSEYAPDLSNGRLSFSSRGGNWNAKSQTTIEKGI
ncbi:hypothetical protein ACFE04_022257 [Oxalis oulophora]